MKTLYPTAVCGFTLIDLLIVIAIVYITAGLGLPSFRQLQSDTRAYMYVKSLSRDIIYARNYAINYGIPVTICPLKHSKCSKDWSKDVTIFVDLNLNRSKNDEEKILKILDSPPKRDSFIFPRRGITFRPDGSLNGFQSGTFRYCPDTIDSINSQGLTINQAGRPRYRAAKIDCKK